MFPLLPSNGRSSIGVAILNSQNSLYCRSFRTAGATKLSAHVVAAVLCLYNAHAQMKHVDSIAIVN